MDEQMNVGGPSTYPVMDNMALKKIIDAPEIENIKHDLDSLNKNGRMLVKNLKSEGGEVVRESVENIKASGRAEIHKIEDFVKEKPMQGVAFGVVAGAVLSWLIGLRRK